MNIQKGSFYFYNSEMILYTWRAGAWAGAVGKTGSHPTLMQS